MELRDAWEKLYADMATNEQAARCDDYTVLDQAEALLPGRFRAEYVKEKDKLIAAHKSGYKALVTFLQREGSLIERYLPDKLLAKTESDGNVQSEAEKDKEIRILKQKLCALEKKEGTQTTRADMEEKLGKCPLCKVHHYWQPNGRDSKKPAS